MILRPVLAGLRYYRLLALRKVIDMRSKYSIMYIVFALALMSVGVRAQSRENTGFQDECCKDNVKYYQRYEDNGPVPKEFDQDNNPDEQRGRRGGMGGPGREGRRGFGRGMFGPPMTTEELMTFLGKYDPEKAQQFGEMYKKQPEDFEKYIGMVCELYTPASRMMDFNEDIGKFMVKNISLSLDIKKVVSDYKKAEDEPSKARFRQQLKVKLEEQFDVIIQLQENEIKGWQDRISQFRERMENGELEDDNQEAGRGRGFGRGGSDMQDRFQHMHKRMAQEVERRKGDIVKWKEQKQQIVERQISDLVEDVRPFPWNR